MEQEDFDKTQFKAGMRVNYKGAEYPVVGVNFEERLLGLGDDFENDDLTWVRCENAEFI